MSKEGAFNGYIEVNGVNLSDHCREFDGPLGRGSVPQNAMGDTTEYGAPALITVEVTATYIQDYASASVHKVHSPLFNNGNIIPVRWAAKLPSVAALGSANNPLYSMDAFVSNYRGIGGSHGGDSAATATYSPAGNLQGGG